jgi:hypothetical protein
MNEKTRFILAIGVLALYFVQGIIKAFQPSFPYVEAIAAEGAIAAYYFTTKTISNMNQAKYVKDPPCPPEVNDSEK